MQRAFEQVKELLADKNLTNYRISQETGIAQSTLSDLKRNSDKINRMPVENAIKLHNLYLKEMEGMENIKNIIAQIENGEIELENLDPNYHEEEYIDGCNGVWIAHEVEGHEDLEVFFAEHDEVEELRQRIYEGDADESELEELVFNEYADRFNYDDVVAYRIDGGEVQWI